MRINVALIALVFSAPDLIEQCVTRPGASRLGGEQFQNLKFERRQIHTRACARYFVTPFVYDQIADLYALLTVDGLFDGGAAAEQRLDTYFQLARAKRLGQIIVRSGLESGHLVVN